MRFRQYRVTRDAVRQGRLAGLYGDTAKRLARMARRSAPVTSEHGNRRFDDFILQVVDDKVLGVTRLYPGMINV
ncbi:hypothetical protein [Sinorhizobium fredii]|uniref:hypothetical protein n=1 Tax=Rhizobium fredii TaxID=380 RepID=UPI001294AF0E|nr:hypothetical protein [Sinorhizobium fredii]MQW94024.1 hypothetical protein [Sinorhizobium fredii]